MFINDNKNNIDNIMNDNLNGKSQYENYYKDIDKPIINNYLSKFNLKNLLELSSITDLNLFTKKKKNEWKLKEKRILLKECDIKRKQKIKEVSSSLNMLTKYKSKDIILDVKKKNKDILDEIETIDVLIDTIEKDYPEHNGGSLKNNKIKQNDEQISNYINTNTNIIKLNFLEKFSN